MLNKDEYSVSLILQLHKGDYFMPTPNSKKVYIKGEYDHSTRKYICKSFDDISYSRQFVGSKSIITDFTF